MKELEKVRARYMEHNAKLMIAANTSDSGRKLRCLEVAAFYLSAAVAIEALIAQ
jgi:hypothetical protein